MTSTDLTLIPLAIAENEEPPADLSLDLTKDEAEGMLSLAKTGYATLADALKALHNRRGYIALGYSSFKSMIDTEFPEISVRTAYRWLELDDKPHQASAQKALATKAAKKADVVVPLSAQAKLALSEAQAQTPSAVSTDPEPFPVKIVLDNGDSWPASSSWCWAATNPETIEGEVAEETTDDEERLTSADVELMLTDIRGWALTADEAEVTVVLKSLVALAVEIRDLASTD